MAVLPNRYLVKLDTNTDYFKTYLSYIGALRLTIGSATSIGGAEKSGSKGFFAKMVKDVPDCYCKINVGAEAEWRTSTKNNDHHPAWNETHDFLIADYDQQVLIDIQDDDFAGDDDIGIATTTVKDILLNGGSKDLDIIHKGELTTAKITVQAKFFNFIDDVNVLTSTQSGGDEGNLVGLVTILIANVLGLQGRCEELNPSIKVAWGNREFCTAAKSYSPGTDIFNPSFDQSFHIPVTADLLVNPPSFRIALLNKNCETGFAEIPFSEVLNAPALKKEGVFDVGSGATVRASVSLRGMQLAG
ncbi:hypothetical protein H072_10815 [Dactylellina haptotyla CBS 200.50]|uniref:C2 domain-containing protein n=1 Tax=Dactylellina haptotyla (strain CBS 200.50) TaxID=1284197 RepID=S8B9I8_DACHA|nr:hypothetical protein H072_10815 [Dactylellina haptotyla CBS 200.50]